MNSEDFAIVVGISHYPGLGEHPGEAADLRAPDDDATAIRDWLVDPNCGAVPEGNVALIRSRDFPPPTDVVVAEPQQARIGQAFSRLELLAQSNRAQGKGLRVGRRLYIYAAGHGFAPKRREGCLFTANATRVQTHNVYATGWLEWFQDAGYFDEYVLWMDCCMDREFSIVPEAIPFRLQGVPRPPGPTFIALAAPRPLRTVEREIPADGHRVHGVFTWALLEGLRGAAADLQTASVTGHTLGGYLFNAVKGLLHASDLSNPDVAKEPEVVTADPRLIFAVNVRARHQVKLTFPSLAEGKMARLWSGSPPVSGAPIPIAGGKIETSLERGLYLVDVPDARLRQGFEVTGSGPVVAAITEQGPSVTTAEARANFDLVLDPNNPAAEIFVIDYGFALVARGRSRLIVGQPFGLYKVKIRVGREVVERVILVDQNVSNVGLAAPEVASPVPAYGTALTHEYHESAASQLPQNPHVTAGDGAEVFLMTRMWTGRGGSASGARPWEGIVLVDRRGSRITDLARHGERYTVGDRFRSWQVEDPFAFCTAAVTPGTYFLRQRLTDGRVFEQSLVVPAGWRLEAYVVRLAGSNGTALLPGRHLAVLMHRVGTRSPMEGNVLLDTARIALADERRILNPELEGLLLMKFDNPIAGLIGAHLLLLEEERAESPDQRPDLRLIDHVVTNLRSLVGNDHPDVEAISLRCPNTTLRTSRPFHVPPMFARSWDLVVQASGDRPELVPNPLWRRVHAATALAPYMVWARDPRSRAAHRRQVEVWVADAARAAAVPFAARAGVSPESRSVESAETVLGATYLPEPTAEIRAQARRNRIPDAALKELWHAQTRAGRR